MASMLIETDLPDDPNALRAIILAQEEERRILTDRVVTLRTAGAEADAEIARLTAIITAFQRHRFGARSEKLDDDQFELALEELDAALSRVQAGLDAAKKRSGGTRPRKANRGSLPAHLERVEQVIDVEDKACACCGGALHVIGSRGIARDPAAASTFHRKVREARMSRSGSTSSRPPSASW